MESPKSVRSPRSSRREFLRRSASLATATVVAGALPLARSAHAAGGGEEIKVALIGCGARGTGAAAQALSTAGPVKLWALADAFEDRLQSSLNSLSRGQKGRYDTPTHAGFGAKVDVPPERQFVGLDAYQKAIDSGVDMVVFGQPPAFRAAHFEYAVKAGKHVFMEKPLATDAPEVRRILAAGELAKQKNLKVGVGLQRHHQPSYIDIVQRVRDGAIGKIQFLRCYWNGGPPAKTPMSREGLTEMQYQLRNWYFFTWLSGDHIVEQHIHNIDVCNWVLDAHPVEAQGMGGRQVRTGREFGQIFDHHAVEFTYADGTKMFSQCRQIPGCYNSVSEHAHGTKGTADLGKGAIVLAGPAAAPKTGKRTREAGPSPYQLEHDHLFDAIRNNKPYNEVAYAAMTTMTAILGRMATYSGKVVSWDDAFASTLSLQPEKLAWDAPPPVLPDAEGRYPAAVPGVTKAW